MRLGLGLVDVRLSDHGDGIGIRYERGRQRERELRHGNPLERDPERVRADVRDGYVSIEAAARDYGVVLDPETLEIIEKGATRA